MSDSRTKNTGRNIIWGVANKLITLILPFIIRTAILRILGSEYLGLSSLFTSILQVLNLAELGFSSAVVFSMYKPLAEDDTDTVCALMNLYRKVYTVIGLVILAAGFCVLPFLDKFISGTYPSDINIYILYLIYLINTALTYFLFAYKKSILIASQRNDIVSNVASIVHLGMYLCQIIILVVSKNYYLYAILLPIFTIIDNIIDAVIANKKYPQYQCRGNLDKKQLADIKTRIFGIMLGKICGTTRNSFDSLFISMFIGLTAVAIYGNYYYIMSGIQGILVVVTVSMKASIGNSVATESVEKNHKDMMTFNFLYMWISGWCAVCLMCLLQHFMRIWVGEELMFDIPIVILFVIYFYALAIGDMRNIYVEATGLWWEQRYRAIGEAICNVVLNALFVQVWGVMGIILATLLSLLIFNIIYGSQIIYKFYFKQHSVWEYYRKHIFYFVVTSIATGITYAVCSFLPDFGVISFVLKLLICCVIPNIIFLIFYCRQTEFASAKAVIKRFLKVK